MNTLKGCQCSIGMRNILKEQPCASAGQLGGYDSFWSASKVDLPLEWLCRWAILLFSLCRGRRLKSIRNTANQTPYEDHRHRVNLQRPGDLRDLGSITQGHG